MWTPGNRSNGRILYVLVYFWGGLVIRSWCQTPLPRQQVCCATPAAAPKINPELANKRKPSLFTCARPFEYSNLKRPFCKLERLPTVPKLFFFFFLTSTSTILTRDGTAQPVSRDQILRQLYPVDPYSCYTCVIHTYSCTLHKTVTAVPTIIYCIVAHKARVQLIGDP